VEQQEIIAKLKALRNSIAKWVENPRARVFDPQTVLDVFYRYATLRDTLRSEHPSLFGDLPVREVPKSSGTSEFDGRGYIIGQTLRLLLTDIDYCLDILSNITRVELPSMKVTREGVFFAGQYFDALQRLAEILSHAQQSIVIIDGYIDEDVLDLLTSKEQAVEVNILTKTVSPALSAAATAFNKQYEKLSIRTSQAFHDRFVIVDDHDYYHFGASLKDLGHRGFMFSRIEEPDVIDKLRAKWVQEWKTATEEV